jgi:hypothetical protein
MRGKFSRTIAIATVAVALVAGCSRSDETAVGRHDANAPQPNPVTAASKAEQSAPVAGVTFEVTPLQFRKCDAVKGRTVVNVKWDVTAAGVQYVNVLINSGGAEPTLFTTGKATGERKTGNWVVDGTQIILQNAANKKQLATVTISGQDC